MRDDDDLRLRFSRRYSMGHRLISGEAPACRVPHGHDEVVTVDILAVDANLRLDPKTNMLAEFDRVKRRWFQWIDNAVDHSFHISDQDPLLGFFRTTEPYLLDRLLVTPGDPTTEIRAACFKAKLGAFLSQDEPGFCCDRLLIQETPVNAVEIRASKLERYLPEGDHWWHRADLSINDLSRSTCDG